MLKTILLASGVHAALEKMMISQVVKSIKRVLLPFSRDTKTINRLHFLQALKYYFPILVKVNKNINFNDSNYRLTTTNNISFPAAQQQSKPGSHNKQPSATGQAHILIDLLRKLQRISLYELIEGMPQALEIGNDAILYFTNWQEMQGMNGSDTLAVTAKVVVNDNIVNSGTLRLWVNPITLTYDTAFPALHGISNSKVYSSFAKIISNLKPLSQPRQ